MTPPPALAVVIIGRNEGARLARCLRSLAPLRQNDPATEIIYVDSASTDDSCAIATELGARVLEVAPARPCAAVGRNAGWRAATAPIVLFLDGDTILAPDFVPHALPLFADPAVGVVFGNRREIATRESVYNRVLDLDWIVPPGPAEYCGGDALIRREILQRLEGYDEGLIAGEEPELCWRIRALRYRIEHLDRPMVGHDLAITRAAQYWRRAVRTGYAYAEVSARFRGSAAPLWERPARRNLIHGPVMLALTLGALVLTVLTASATPVVLASLLTVGLAIRSAVRARWKTPEAVTLLLYGFHSHLGQIPIFFGQLKWRLDRWRRRIPDLIEYKTPDQRTSRASQ
jgi:cellulose synthase/poly-beta-1,6-N-acetylglucosamine synthase-like glycosyltransferase